MSLTPNDNCDREPLEPSSVVRFLYRHLLVSRCEHWYVCSTAAWRFRRPPAMNLRLGYTPFWHHLLFAFILPPALNIYCFRLNIVDPPPTYGVGTTDSSNRQQCRYRRYPPSVGLLYFRLQRLAFENVHKFSCFQKIHSNPFGRRGAERT